MSITSEGDPRFAADLSAAPETREKTPFWRRNASGWLSWLRVLIVFVVVVLAGVALWWAGSLTENEPSVAQQWNESIQRLGFEPVYPPVEDIVVGDVLAMISDDAAHDISSEPFAGRSIKLVHLDLTDEIERAYRDIYQFPDTIARPSTPAELWPQAAANGSIFKQPAVRNTLPIVVFPGFTITRSRRAGVSGAFSRLWDATVGAASSSTEVIDVKIAGAETYGIPALPAEIRLYKFCTGESTGPLCSDAGLRQQLSIVVGSKIHDKVIDPTTKAEKPRFSVEIALISRIYLARSIETRIRRDNAVSGDLGGPSSERQTEKGADASPGPTPSTPPANAPAPSQPSGQQNDAETGQAAGQVGLSGTLQNRRSSDLFLPPTVVARPVVIGFKSIRWMPEGRSK
jgi:hypothetical protein